MTCLVCQSSNQRTFTSELNIHFPGFEGLSRPSVWAFPRLVVCLDCGFTQFALSDDQLKELRSGARSEAAAA